MDGIDKLYEGLNEHFDLGTPEEFRTKIQDNTHRKNLYDAISPNFDLGVEDYDAFSSKIDSYLHPSWEGKDLDDLTADDYENYLAAQQRQQAAEQKARQTKQEAEQSAEEKQYASPSAWDVMEHLGNIFNPIKTPLAANKEYVEKMEEKAEKERRQAKRKKEKQSSLPLSQKDMEALSNAWQAGNFSVVNKDKLPSYLTREEKTMSDVYENVVEAWSQNTLEGRAATYEFEKKYSEIEDLVKNGKLSKEDGDKQIEEISNNFFAKALGANEDYIKDKERIIGNQALGGILDEKIEKAQKKVDDLEKLIKEHALSATSPADALRQANRANADLKLGALEYLTDAKKMRDAAMSSDDNAWTNFWRGMGHGLEDTDTWDFGISALKRSSNLKSIIDKLNEAEKEGKDVDKFIEELPEDERAFLDAYCTFQQTCMWNSNELSSWYNAGVTTAEAVPFIAETLLTGVAGLGKGVARALSKRIVGQTAKTATKTAAKVAESLLKKGKRFFKNAFAESVGVGGGAFAESTLQTGLFGIPKIASGVNERRIGNVITYMDSDGTIRYGGIEEGSQQGFWEALKNSAYDLWVENFSERALEAFTPYLKLGKGGAKAWLQGRRMFKYLNSKDWYRAIRDIHNAPWAKSLLENMHFGGYTQEVFEEELGGLMRLMCTDVNTLEEAGLDWDSQADILIGLLPMSLGFGVMQGVGAGIQYGKYKHNSKEVYKHLSSETERALYDKILKGKVEEGVADDARQLIRSTLENDNYSAAKKQEIIEDCLGRVGEKLSQKVEEENKKKKNPNAQTWLNLNGEEVEVPNDVVAEYEKQAKEKAKQFVHPNGMVYEFEFDDDQGNPQTGYIVGGNISQIGNNGKIFVDGDVTIRYADGTEETWSLSGGSMRLNATTLSEESLVDDITRRLVRESISKVSEPTAEEQKKGKKEEKPTTEEQKTEVKEEKREVKPVIEKKKPATITVNGQPQNVTFTGRIVYNEDGSIDREHSGNIYVQDENNKNIPGDAVLDALDESLRAEKIAQQTPVEQPAETPVEQPTEESIQEPVDNRTPEQIAADEAAAAEQAEQQRTDDIYNAVAEQVNQKGADVIARLSPEQKFIWTMREDGLDAAIEDTRGYLEDAANEKDRATRRTKMKQWQALLDKYAPQEQKQETPVQETPQVETTQTETPVQQKVEEPVAETPAAEPAQEVEQEPEEPVAETPVEEPAQEESAQEPATQQEETQDEETENRDEVVNIREDGYAVLLHDVSADKVPLIKVARVSEEDGKKVYREVGTNKEMPVDNGYWREANKQVVQDNDRDYISVEYKKNQAKRLGIPVFSSIAELSAINAQNENRPTVDKLPNRGLTALSKEAKGAGINFKDMPLDDVLEEPLNKQKGNIRESFSLKDLLALAPKMGVSKKGSNVRRTIWNQVEEWCEQTAIRSMQKAEGSDFSEERMRELKSQLLSDIKVAIPQAMDKWNKIVKAKGLDELLIKEIKDEEGNVIDVKSFLERDGLLDTYKMLHKAIYGEELETPTLIFSPKKRRFSEGWYNPTKSDSHPLGADVNIFRYMQTVAEITRRLQDILEDSSVAPFLNIEKGYSFPYEMTVQDARERSSNTAQNQYKNLLDRIAKAKDIKELRKLAQLRYSWQEQYTRISKEESLDKNPKYDLQKANVIEDALSQRASDFGTTLAQLQSSDLMENRSKKTTTDETPEEAAAEQAAAEDIAQEEQQEEEVAQDAVALLEAERNRKMDMLAMARKRGNTEMEEMLLEEINDLGKRIFEAKQQEIRAHIGPEQMERRKEHGMKIVDILRKKGIKISLVSEEKMLSLFDAREVLLMKRNGSVPYGVEINGNIYLLDDYLDPNTPIHEYTHLWFDLYAQQHPSAWANLMEVLKQTDEWQNVLNDENYFDIRDNEYEMTSEVLARLTGYYWSEEFMGKTRFDDTLEGKKLGAKVRSALRSFWESICTLLGKNISRKNKDFEKRLKDILNMPLQDILGEEEKETNFDKKFKKMQEGLDKGGANVLSLQSISDLTDALEDDLRQGNRPLVFERIPLEALQSGIGKQRALAEALTIVSLRSRRSSRALVRDGREVSSDEIASRDGSNTEMLLDLINYAKEKGIWFEDVIDALDSEYGKDNRVSIMSGKSSGESEVWIDAENENVIKAKASNYYETTEEFLEGMLLNNWLFKDNEQRIVGFGIDRRSGKDAIRVIYETPLVDIDHSTPLTQQEKDDYMADFGFSHVDYDTANKGTDKGEASRYTNGQFEISDLHSMNIVKDSDGAIRCIDPIIKWVKGEHYNRQTEEQAERDAENEEKLDEMFRFRIGDAEILEDDNVPVQPAKRMSWLQRRVNAEIDQANGIRLLQKHIGEVEGKKLGMSEDVREVLEAKRSQVMNTQELFTRHEGRHLGKALRAITGAWYKIKDHDPMKDSGLWKRGMTDWYDKKGGPKTKDNTRRLTRQRLLEMYLMAKDTIERMNLDLPVRDEELTFRLLQYLGMPLNTEVKTKEQRKAVMQAMVDKFESGIGSEKINDLWKAINECTNYSLKTLLDGHCIGVNKYNELMKRKFYVPERGFAQLESDAALRYGLQGDAHEFITKQVKKVMPAALKKAKGGSSMATDVLANILYIAYNSIESAYENKVRESAFNLLKNHQEACRKLGYPIATKVWFVRDGSNEDGSPRYTYSIEKPSPETIAENEKVLDKIKRYKEDLELFEDDKDMQEFVKDKIKELKKERTIVPQKDAGDVSVPRLEFAGMDVPKVLASVPTEDGDVELYSMEFPNNPEIANCLNGIYNTRYKNLLLAKIGRFFAANYTTRNFEFFSRNFPADALMVGLKGLSERGVGYPALVAAEMIRLESAAVPIFEHVTGWFDIDDRHSWKHITKDGYVERDFRKFLEGGGNTGFTQMKDMDEFRAQAKRLAEGYGTKDYVLAIPKFLLDSCPRAINEFYELYTRFAVYRATKASLALENKLINLKFWKRGLANVRRTTPYTEEEIEAQALHDARNFSGNFNRQGSGGLMTFFNSISMFANAGIQGVMTVPRTFEEGEYQKGIRGAAALMILPTLVGYFLTGLTPDSDSDEDETAEYIRQNYIVIGGMKIRLPYDLAPYYRIGVNWKLFEQQRISIEDAVENVLKGFAEHALPLPPAINSAISTGIDMVIPEGNFRSENPNPIDMLQNFFQAQFMTSFIDLQYGKSWTGSDLRYQYAKDKPQWMYQDYMEELYKDMSKALYAMRGGSFEEPSITVNGKKMGHFHDQSPKEIKTFLTSLTSNGFMKLWCYAYGLSKECILNDGEDYVSSNSVPVIDNFILKHDNNMFRIQTVSEFNAMTREADENFTRVPGLREMNDRDAEQRIKLWKKVKKNYDKIRTEDLNSTQLHNLRNLLERDYAIRIDGETKEDLLHAYIMVMKYEEIEMKGFKRTIEDMERWKARYNNSPTNNNSRW